MLNSVTTTGGCVKEMVKDKKTADQSGIDLMPDHLIEAVKTLDNSEVIFSFIAKMASDAYDVKIPFPDGYREALCKEGNDDEVTDEIWVSALEYALDNMMYSFKSIFEELVEGYGSINSKLISEIASRLDGANGYTFCHNCGYKWFSRGTKHLVTCPDCGRKTTRGK